VRTGADLEGWDPDAELGYPGEFPFTRGIQPTMYRGRLWTMRQYAGFGTAEESNERYRYLLAQGVSGLSVAFDLPTQMGYDSDHAMAAGEVGRVGVAIDSIEDMATLFDGIPLDQVSTSMTINATAIILLALLLDWMRHWTVLVVATLPLAVILVVPLCVLCSRSVFAPQRSTPRVQFGSHLHFPREGRSGDCNDDGCVP
jgi:methylmalonyl-CoA mutase N-terminal domain/subunit